MDPVGGRSEGGRRRRAAGEARETAARLYRARLRRGPLGDDLPGAVGLAAGDAVGGLELVADGDLVLEFAAVAPAPVGAVADRRHAAVDAAGLPFDAFADGHRHGALLRPGVALLLAFVQGVDELQGERSEEHTSELQSLMRISYAVFCLKKKNKKH